MKKLDFIILGTQKSGTTTIFQLLSEHPGVFIPAGKELPFFVRDDVTPESYQAFISEHYRGKLNSFIIGKVTPNYLSDPRVPERLLSLSNKTLLIAILRDMVERAFSHYRMSVRRGIEKRNFTESIDQMLDSDALIYARALPTGRASENQTYVVWGEYSRLLQLYSKKIANGELLLLSTRKLQNEPEYTIRRLIEYLDLEAVTLPSLGKKTYQGGTKERLTLKAIVKSLVPIKWPWRKLPNSQKQHILFEVARWKLVKSATSLNDVAKETTERLCKHFASDINLIRILSGRQPDWPE